MALIPVRRILERVDIAKQDSDAEYFFSMLYAGEMVIKLVAAGLVSGLMDDRERQRYRQLHRLVRADSLGEWVASIDDILAGPASRQLLLPARVEQKQLTEKLGPGSWQYDALVRLDACLRRLDRTREGLPYRLDGRRWFAMLCELRNRTRGHGATSGAMCSALAPDLRDSLELFVGNFELFRRPWAFLHRNLSGKYRVTKLNDSAAEFDILKSATGRDQWGSLPDGVYVLYDQPYQVELVFSDPEATDFLHPNGSFNGKRFQLISYITDNRGESDAGPYLKPATELPGSETQGLGRLEVIGNCFANLPPTPSGYIRRVSLETELETVLVDERHPVITLVGRGGIGKTSLAQSVLHRLSERERFEAMIWFSARDVDLLPQGPKSVSPHLVSNEDMAREFARLLEPSGMSEKHFKPLEYFAAALSKSPTNKPFLFVFDNFETVQSPADLYKWLDTYVRPPNKILITTRSRDFRGDYPVEVQGMTEEECQLLVEKNAELLDIVRLLTPSYTRQLIRESEGHPYVIKVLLGEVAKAGALTKIERIVASKDDILDALFERTYAGLSPAAKQIFLTLCNWRSTVPMLAIEAVMLDPSNERVDVQDAVSELERSSFAEASVSNEDREIFLSVPLVASVFGNRKLTASPLKTAVQANTQALLQFGAGQKSDIRHGIAPRIERLFRSVAEKVNQNPNELTQFTPMLEFIALRHTPAWLYLASLHEERNDSAGLAAAKNYIRRYLESDSSSESKRAAWIRLTRLCIRTQDWLGELHASVETCELPDTPFESVSDAVNRWNKLHRDKAIALRVDERHILSRRLLEIFEKRLQEADATDCSRIAWLCLALHDESGAKKFVTHGLSLEPSHEHCGNLAVRLGLRT